MLLHELDLIVLKVRHGDALGLELELAMDTGTWRTDKDTKVHDDVWRRLHRTVHADLVFSDEGELAESVLIFFNLELGGHVLWWVGGCVRDVLFFVVVVYRSMCMLLCVLRFCLEIGRAHV